MFTGKNEEQFFLGHINNTSKVLEYGSGASTKQISSITNNLVSVEHDPGWYNSVKNDLPKNVVYLLRPPSTPWNGMSDGDQEQFKEYIIAPQNYGPFDIVFIDGRARAHCCRFAFENLSHDNTIYFIHDYVYPNPPPDRREYLTCLEYLDIIDHVDMMYMFKKKV